MNISLEVRVIRDTIPHCELKIGNVICSYPINKLDWRIRIDPVMASGVDDLDKALKQELESSYV